MKYFVNNWIDDAENVIKKYEEHYKSIENQLTNNVKKVLKNRHDAHIVKAYFKDKNYMIELDEEVWGKATLVFVNATIRHNSNIQDTYWLYEEIYKVEDKNEIHISFYKSDIIILCDDAFVDLKEKDYFKKLYQIKDFKIDMHNPIIEAVSHKEYVCGKDMLENWELLLLSYYQIYAHINYYKNRNIEDLMENHYYTYSEEEKKEIYVQLFTNLEKNIINSIEILRRYQDIIKDENLNYIIRRLLGIYNKKNIPIKEKNQQYLQLNEELHFDFNKMYKRILTCIDERLIK